MMRSRLQAKEYQVVVAVEGEPQAKEQALLTVGLEGSITSWQTPGRCGPVPTISGMSLDGVAIAVSCTRSDGGGGVPGSRI